MDNQKTKAKTIIAYIKLYINVILKIRILQRCCGFILHICCRINPNNWNTKGYWDIKLPIFNNLWGDEYYYRILDLLPKDQEFSLLDVGCAMGDGCELLQKRFQKAIITGVDFSKAGIAKAKKKSKGINYYVLDILKDPIPNEYDYMTIIETLEHFEDPFFVINKLLKHVKKSIIISTPYNQNFTGNIIAGEHRYAFNEVSFKKGNYNYRVAKIMDVAAVTHDKYIIYEIFSNSSEAHF